MGIEKITAKLNSKKTTTPAPAATTAKTTKTAFDMDLMKKAGMPTELIERARQLDIFIECSKRALDAAMKAADEAFERGDIESGLKITKEYETWYENWKGE